jgi:hypothetical protein
VVHWTALIHRGITAARTVNWPGSRVGQESCHQRRHCISLPESFSRRNSSEFFAIIAVQDH